MYFFVAIIFIFLELYISVFTCCKGIKGSYIKQDILKIKKIELQLSLFIEQIFYLQTDYYLLKENYSLATSNKIK